MKERIRKEANHVTFPNTELIFAENGTFRGRVWDLTQLRAIKKLAEENNVKVHVDGARIFNALATYNIEGKELSDTFDSMTICLTKGLSCPIGAAVIGSKQLIKELKNIRKGLGGGLWHPGILTAAGNYALDHLLPEIKLDNEMAQLLATELSSIKGIEVDPSAVQINMVYWTVSTPNFNHQQFHEYLSSQHIRSKAFDEDTNDYRFVTHSGIRRAEVEKVVAAIKHYFESL